MTREPSNRNQQSKAALLLVRHFGYSSIRCLNGPSRAVSTLDRPRGSHNTDLMPAEEHPPVIDAIDDQLVVARSLQDDSMCRIKPKTLNTALNSIDEVPTFYGILMTIVATSNIDILTFELDVRLNEGDDMSIDVYTLDGEFAELGDHLLYNNDRSQWTQLASTRGVSVVAPQGEALIVPSSEFTPVSMVNGEHRSFYFAMRGPYLDSVVDAFQQQGEVQVRGPDFRLMVGAGLSEDNFPPEIDPVVSPMFAGVVHYRRSGDCNEAETSTTIEYQFLLNREIGLDIDTVVNEFVQEFIADHAIFQQFQSQYKMQARYPSTVKEEYTGGCPVEWESCTPFYLRTLVEFTHTEALDPRRLTYEFYRPTDEIQIKAQQVYGADEIVYIGLKSVEADFEATLRGVGMAMDEVQTEYFASVTEDFLYYRVDPLLAANFDVLIDQQLTSGGGRGRSIRGLQEESSVKVKGVIRGARYVYKSDDEFDSALRSAFRSDSGLYDEMIKQGIFRPGPINDNGRFAYFTDLSSISATVLRIGDASATPSDADPTLEATGGVNITVLAAVVGALGGLLLIVGIYFLFRRIKRRREETARLTEYRARMKEERRQRREERQSRYSQLEEDQEQAPTAPESQAEDPSAQHEVTGDEHEEEKSTGGTSEASFDVSPSVTDLDASTKESEPNRLSPVVRKAPTRSKSYDGCSSTLSGYLKTQGSIPGTASGGRSVDGAPPRRAHSHIGSRNSLGSFMDRQPRPNSYSMSAAQTVGPGVAPFFRRPDNWYEDWPRDIPRPPSKRKLTDEPRQGWKGLLGRSGSVDDSSDKPSSVPLDPSVYSAGRARSRSLDAADPNFSPIRKGKKKGELSTFMDSQPKPKADRMSGAQTVGHAPPGTRKAPLRSKSDGVPNGSLAGFMRNQPEPKSTSMRGSRSVGVPLSPRKPARAPPSPVKQHVMRSKSDNTALRNMATAPSKPPVSPRKKKLHRSKSNVNSLHGFIEKQPTASGLTPSGSKSVGGLPEATVRAGRKRTPSRTSSGTENKSNASPSGFITQQAPSSKGAESVGPGVTPNQRARSKSVNV